MLFDPPTNNTDHVPPTALATLAPAQAQVSGIHVLVLIVAVVLVTAVVSCVLGHSKMGARLWSQRRSARTNPASHHHHAHTIITPATFTHSDKVPTATDLGRLTSLRRYHTPSRPRPASDPSHPTAPAPAPALWPMEYGKDGQPAPPHSSKRKKKGREVWSHEQQQALHSSPDQVLLMSMDAATSARDHATLQRSVQRDTQLGFPYQVPRQDGEERHPPTKYTIGPEHEEIQRGVVKAPANRTVIDAGNEATHRPSHFGVHPSQSECEMMGPFGPYTHHHHSHLLPPPSSSSLSSSQLGYGDKGRSSPIRSQKMGVNLRPLAQHYRPPFSPSKYQESSRRGGWHQGSSLGMSSPSPSHDHSNPLLYSSVSNTLADITTTPVGCGPTPLSPGDRHAEVPGDSQAMSVESLGVQGGVTQRYGPFSESPCSPTAEPDHPPLYSSDAIDNSNLYTSVSRPSEQRTKSGEI